MAFELKPWLDQHVIPLLAGPPPAIFHAELHQGASPGGPTAIMVFLRAAEPSEWPALAKRLLESGFAFDYLREHAVVRVGEQLATVFGGDGTPFFNKEGMAMVRLFKKVDDRVLLLDVGGKYENVNAAKDGVKAFFALFDQGGAAAGAMNALEVCRKFRPAFGESGAIDSHEE